MKNEKVSAYIEKQAPYQKNISKKLRNIIFKVSPEIIEDLKWGVPSYADGKIYIVALKDHVNLGFSVKELSKEEQKLLRGSGKTMKHLEIHTLKDIDEKIITQIMSKVLR